MKEFPIPSFAAHDAEMLALAERLAARIQSLGGAVMGVRGMRLVAGVRQNAQDHRRADVRFEYEGRYRQLSWDDLGREPDDYHLKEMMSSQD